MKYNLKDKVVLITGASRGIGRAIALKLALNEARVLLLSRNSKELSELNNYYDSKLFKSSYSLTNYYKFIC